MEKIRKGDSQKREDAGVRKGRKGAKHCVFTMFCGSGGSNSRLAKAGGAEPAGQMRDQKVHAAVARSTFESKKCQCGTKHIWKANVAKTFAFQPILRRQTSSC